MPSKHPESRYPFQVQLDAEKQPECRLEVWEHLEIRGELLRVSIELGKSEPETWRMLMRLGLMAVQSGVLHEHVDLTAGR